MSKQTKKSFLVKTEKVFGRSIGIRGLDLVPGLASGDGAERGQTPVPHSFGSGLFGDPVPPRFSQHRDTTSIHAVIRDKTDLAKVYAEDGAFHSAARVLEDLATIVSRHAMSEAGMVGCPGHVASATDPKVCARCGIHIDELRPDEEDPINLAGSGPVQIEAREEIAPPASAMRGPLSIGGPGGVGELTIEVGEAPLKLCIDKDWLKQKIGEDGEEGEIGAGFEMFPLPIQAREG
ncbi:MAG: hypothetical protein EOS63_17340 [Mesorhizobium sp.]|uniref:hypothetical protein n=1 Tax=Mesorhizobium sp. TaxID=1871066 RepID=UPI000FE551E1|nr:hypothetical protein [Mesorhizobium sp.]RWE78520.1 MAG: hypothetical protein EOS63_17340 [Mesorhizobium sp.]TJW61030.1 MAG: hypothetical protein E5V97_22205 [Mesorhizobium sp.]